MRVKSIPMPKSRVFLLFLVFGILCNACATKSDNRSLTIALQPFEDFPQDYMDTVSAVLKTTFSADVVHLSPMTLPKTAFVNQKSPRFRGDSLLLHLRANKSSSHDIVLGLTTKDISVTKRDWQGAILQPESKYADWGVFGVAIYNQPYALVSTFRLNSKHALFVDRLVKICIHEIGHNLALPHCDSERCIMRDAAESIQTIDGVERTFCESCSKQIIR